MNKVLTINIFVLYDIISKTKQGRPNMAKKNETMKPIVITVRKDFAKGRRISVVKNVSMRQKIVTNVRSQAVNIEQYMDQSELPGAVVGISKNEGFYSCGDKVAKPQTMCNKAVAKVVADERVTQTMGNKAIADERVTQTMGNKAIADERVTQTMGNKAIADERVTETIGDKTMGGERATETMCNKTITNENIILDGCYNVLKNSTKVYELGNVYCVFENGEVRAGKEVYSIENAGSTYILRLNTEGQPTVFFSNQDESIAFPGLDKLYDACKEKWFQNSHQEKLTRAANFFKNRGM